MDAKRFRKAADTLERYNGEANRILRIRESYTYEREGHECGTVACVAGHYLLARRKDNFTAAKANDLSDLPPWCSARGVKNLRVYVDADHERVFWGAGTYILADDLGFTDPGDMERWARENPDLWGAPVSSDMFMTQRAWGLKPELQSRPEEMMTLEHVIAHLRGVADRLEEANAG